jgi:hypothetical protein
MDKYDYDQVLRNMTGQELNGEINTRTNGYVGEWDLFTLDELMLERKRRAEKKARPAKKQEDDQGWIG